MKTIKLPQKIFLHIEIENYAEVCYNILLIKQNHKYL